MGGIIDGKMAGKQTIHFITSNASIGRERSNGI
jgi:hypothetical protein